MLNNPLAYVEAIKTDCRILAGDDVGPSDSSWQDVAGTLAGNLRCLADCLDAMRGGQRLPADAGDVASALLADTE